MSTVSPFNFPGFTYLRNEDTDTHEVVVGMLKDGEAVYTVSLIRNLLFSHLKLLIARVEQREKKWGFQDEKSEGVGLLAIALGKPVVAICTRGAGSKVERVIPFSNIFTKAPLDIGVRAELKKEAADFLGLPYVFTDIEKKLFAKRTAEKEQEAYEAKQAAREDRVRAIMARPRLTAFSSDGRERLGVPVVETEWPMLNKGTRVILVDSLEEGGVPLESFEVGKSRGKNPEKLYRVQVSVHKPQIAAVSAQAPAPVGEAIVSLPSGTFEVYLYRSMDAIREARKFGLNGGTYVAVDPGRLDVPLEIFAVYHDRVETIGNHRRLVL